MILRTPRLDLREMTEEDLPALRASLQDPVTMTAYEGAFDEDQVQTWLQRTLDRYRDDGYALWAVVLRDTGEMIGQCGPTVQHILDEDVLEPEPRRSAAEHVPAGRERPPDLARVRLHGAAVQPGHAQRVVRNTLRHEHPHQVVVRDHQQRRGVAERLVALEHRHVDVPVHRDQREVPRRREDLAGDRAGAGVGRQGAVGVELPAPAAVRQRVLSVRGPRWERSGNLCSPDSAPIRSE